MNVGYFLEEERKNQETITGRIISISTDARQWRNGEFGNVVHIHRGDGYRYYSNVSPSSFTRVSLAAAKLNSGRQNDRTRYHVKFPQGENQ